LISPLLGRKQALIFTSLPREKRSDREKQRGKEKRSSSYTRGGESGKKMKTD